MVFGAVLCAVSNSATNAFQNLYIVDISVVRHDVGPRIVIIHLAVNKVVSGSGDYNEASVVVNGTQLVMHNPVGYEITYCVTKKLSVVCIW